MAKWKDGEFLGRGWWGGSDDRRCGLPAKSLLAGPSRWSDLWVGNRLVVGINVASCAVRKVNTIGVIFVQLLPCRIGLSKQIMRGRVVTFKMGASYV
jgi:hypothetical protein